MIESDQKNSVLKVTYTKAFILLMLTMLAYLIFKLLSNEPQTQTEEQKLQQVREFATFIDQNPKFIQKPIEIKKVNSLEHAPNPSLKVDETNKNESLNIEDRHLMYEITSQWNEEGFTRNQEWEKQMETLFEIAERTKAPDAIDLIKNQLDSSKDDQNPEILRRVELWRERYNSIENRR